MKRLYNKILVIPFDCFKNIRICRVGNAQPTFISFSKLLLFYVQFINKPTPGFFLYIYTLLKSKLCLIIYKIAIFKFLLTMSWDIAKNQRLAICSGVLIFIL